MSGFTLTAREASLVSDVVSSAEEPSTYPLPWSVLELVQDSIQTLALTSFDVTLPRIVYRQSIEEWGERDYTSRTATEAQQNPFWQVYWDPDRAVVIRTARETTVGSEGPAMSRVSVRGAPLLAPMTMGSSPTI